MVESAERVQEDRTQEEENEDIDNRTLLRAMREILDERNATPASNYQSIKALERRLSRVEAALTEETE
jgi:hypothetical protein